MPVNMVIPPSTDDITKHHTIKFVLRDITPCRDCVMLSGGLNLVGVERKITMNTNECMVDVFVGGWRSCEERSII